MPQSHPALINLESKLQRLEACNRLIETIAATGRQFFFHKDRLARIEMDDRGRLWFLDDYTQKRIYLHYGGRWKHFSHGGTLRSLILDLKRFVQSGIPCRRSLGPFPSIMCGGDPWGYREDMKVVRERAIELGIYTAEEKSN